MKTIFWGFTVTKPNENVKRAHKSAVGVRMVRVPDPMLWKPADEEKIKRDLADSARFYDENKGDSSKIKIYKMGSAVAI